MVSSSETVLGLSTRLASSRPNIVITPVVDHIKDVRPTAYVMSSITVDGSTSHVDKKTSVTAVTTMRKYYT